MVQNYNQDAANMRHRERRVRLQEIRNSLNAIVDEYYEDFPESEQGERNLEYRIEERLREVQRSMDRFIADFRRYPNE